jgi:hypothetical protein
MTALVFGIYQCQTSRPIQIALPPDRILAIFSHKACDAFLHDLGTAQAAAHARIISSRTRANGIS